MRRTKEIVWDVGILLAFGYWHVGTLRITLVGKSGSCRADEFCPRGRVGVMDAKKGPTEKLTLSACLERLKGAGFRSQERGGGRVQVSKYGCAAVLEETGAGELRFAVQPGLVVGDNTAHLVDRGFQKFWQDGSHNRPAVAEELKSLHNFQQDLRAALGLTTFYNEALGTVSSRYVYDRVEGREEPKRHEPSIERQ